MRIALASLFWVLIAAGGAMAQSPAPRLFDVCPTPGLSEECEPQALHEINPQGRQIWIRTIVHSGDIPSDGPAAVYVLAMAASQAYWNGELIGRNGSPGASRDEETPGVMDWVLYLPPSLIREGPNELVVHMSSHHNLVSVVRPVHVVGTGRYADAQTLRLSHYLPAALTVGGLLLAALYFGGAFWQDRRNWASLFLALLSLSVVGQFAAEVSRGLIDYPYTWHLPRLIAVALFALGFAVSLSCYVAWRVDQRRLLLALVATTALGAAAVLFSPTFDLKALAPILIGALISLALVLSRIQQAGRAEWLMGGSITLFIVLTVARQDLFLDRDFYLAAFVLAGVLFVGELQVRRRDRLERAAAISRAKELEVELLRRQISPHFLMNTLNTLSAWVEQDPGKGLDIIETLAEEYRAIDRLSLHKLVPITDEIALCRAHLKLLGYRADATFNLVVQGATDRILIPPTVLLTMVENAFSHNSYEGDETITIDIEGTSTSWRISMRAPRKGWVQRGAHNGTGYRYVRARLEDAFGSTRSTFEESMGRDEWHGTIVVPKTND